MNTIRFFLTKEFLNLFLPLAFVLIYTSIVFGQTTKVDVILKSIDTKSRTIEVEHNGKSSQLDLSSKVKVTIKGEAAEASALIAGDEATVEYHKELAVVTAIDAKKNDSGLAKNGTGITDSPAGGLNLNGTWFEVAEDFKGAETPEAQIKARKRTLTLIDDRFVLHTLGNQPNEKPWVVKGTMTINPDSKPVEFDWSGTRRNGDFSEKVQMIGALEIKSDVLRIVYSIRKKAADSPRPTRFSSSGDGAGDFVIVFKREPLE